MFVVHGREADQINIAGHRVSLGDLNQKLLEIDGVQDGVFFLPEEGAESRHAADGVCRGPWKNQ